jgi:hypothetical protein
LTTVVVLPTPPFWFAQAMIWPNQVPISVVQNKPILAFGAVARFGGWLLKQVLPTRARFVRAPARHLRVCRRAEGIWVRLAPAYSALYDVAATSHRSGVYGRCAAAHHQKVLPPGVRQVLPYWRCRRAGLSLALPDTRKGHRVPGLSSTAVRLRTQPAPLAPGGCSRSRLGGYGLAVRVLCFWRHPPPSPLSFT